MAAPKDCCDKIKAVKQIRIYQEYIKIGMVFVAVVVMFALLQKTAKVDKIFEAGGIIALAATIFAETGLLMGFFLPGDTLLFAAGFFAAQGKIDLIITLFALFAAAVLGNMMGYEIGRRSGSRLFNRPDSILFHKENVDRARAFFEQHGGKTVIFARFIPVVRTISSPLAGMGSMSYAKFMSYNLLGAILWVPIVTFVGYWAGKVLGHYINVDRYILPLAVLATLATFGASFFHVLRDPIARQKLREKLRRLKRED